LGRLRFLKYLPQLIFSVLAFGGAILTVCQRNHEGWLFVAVLVLYPLNYYLTHAFKGFFYQYPMYPEMLALATAAIVREDGKPNEDGTAGRETVPGQR